MSLLINISIAVIGPLFIWLLTRKMRKARIAGRALKAIPLTVLIAVIYTGLMAVETGTIMVVRSFGKIHERSYDEGLHFVNPLSKRNAMETRRNLFELQSVQNPGPQPMQNRGLQTSQDIAAKQAKVSSASSLLKTTISLSRDRVPLTIDAGFPYKLNGGLAWKVYQKIGPAFSDRLLKPAARTAVRDAVAHFTWADAVTNRREELASKIHALYQGMIVEDLMMAGFSPEEAKTAFKLMPVQIRRMLPPKRILDAVSERLAAEEDLQRQKVLTDIARQEADRRANEGLGVKKLFAELPSGFTAGQISHVLGALADKQRADALLKAVENQNISVIVLGGGSKGETPMPAISIPSQ